MDYLIVDDENLILRDEARTLQAVVGEDSHIHTVDNYKDALDIVGQVHPYVVFLDVDMPEMSGLDLSRKIEEISPDSNIVFVTGYQKYGIDAWRTKASAFLLKPAKKEDFEEALKMLRKPVSGDGKVKPKLEFHCFGNFEVFYEGKPLLFKRRHCKEFIAYLIDKHGASVSADELRSIIWGEEEDTEAKKSYIRTLASDIRRSFALCDAKDIFMNNHGVYSIDTTHIYCDLYEYEAGRLPKEYFHGEYMNQYGWAEETCAMLMRE